MRRSEMQLQAIYLFTPLFLFCNSHGMSKRDLDCVFVVEYDRESFLLAKQTNYSKNGCFQWIATIQISKILFGF